MTTEPFSTYITGLPAAVSIGAGDSLYVLQGGVSKQAPGSALITAPISNGQLAVMANLTIKSNFSGGSATPADNTLSAILDIVLGSAQGDIIFRGASAWTILAPGTAGNLLRTGGAGADPSWTPPATFIKTVTKQTFTSSGTYTPTTGMVYCIVEMVGGGGGGGGAQSTASSAFGGGGGASGTYSRSVIAAATIGVSQTVTIGAAGTGGSAGPNNGGSGGTTSVGVLVTAPGGNGGAFGDAAQAGNGGTPGSAGTGDLSVPGAPGAFGIYNSTGQAPTFGSGNGAPSYYGGGGKGVQTNGSTGGAGTGFGDGGAGGYTNAGTTNAAGGAGSKGYVFITEFLNQ